MAKKKKTKKTKSKPVRVKRVRIKRPLTCSLNDEEVCRAADMLSNILAERDAMELRKKSAMDNFRAELKTLERGIRKFANIVRTKTETRDVTVAITYDLKKRQATEVRTDTGEIIDCRVMDDGECPDLFGNVEPADKKEDGENGE